jgi:uncharacterized protein DUF3775
MSKLESDLLISPLVQARYRILREQTMLKDLNVDQARFIATLADAARAQRDAHLGRVRERALAEPKPVRGEHNPTAALAFEPLPTSDVQLSALQEAVNALSPPARREVYALMRIGQGHLSTKRWHRGLVEAESLGNDSVTAAIMEDPDLHHHIAKGLYETKLLV